MYWQKEASNCERPNGPKGKRLLEKDSHKEKEKNTEDPHMVVAKLGYTPNCIESL